MTIVICGSMVFAQDMLDTQKILVKKGHQVIVPVFTKTYVTDSEWRNEAQGPGTIIGAQRKIDNDLIKKHYWKIKSGDAILVINKEKSGIKGYVGGNSFLEMGFAYISGKKIFVLNSLPKELKLIYQELVAMQPIILNGDLAKIK